MRRAILLNETEAMARAAASKKSKEKRVSLFTLASGEINGITSYMGGCLAEAACICLEDQQHASGVKLAVNGALEDTLELLWESATGQMRRCWNDSQEATEFGACGIAIVIIYHLTDLTVVERSCKGTGFDYWLGPKSSKDDLFQNKARLEVSGIRSGDDSNLKKVVAAKTKQTKRSDDSGLPAYVVVVEFSAPRSQVVKR